MGTFTKGDVVLFPFPYTDLSNRKLRPCLVLSDKMSNDIILCQITSKRKKDKYVIDLPKESTNKGSLMIDSYIRGNMTFTATVDQITRKVCSVNKEKYSQVVSLINKIIKK